MRPPSVAAVQASDLPCGAAAGGGEVDERTFEAIMFDWDGGPRVAEAAESDAAAGAAPVSRRCAPPGVHVFVVSDIDVAAIDRQLGRARAGRAGCTSVSAAGSEVFEVGSGDGPDLRWRQGRPARGRGRPLSHGDRRTPCVERLD